ncbi:MAG: nucleotidyltransferase domain-containing protein [Aigarchaeota archaeon]|nr:nucleotidyltransferase domain-containing protein [Candidatus Pelearchaeum maunauluense]
MKYIERVKRVYCIDGVILFGSRARGDYAPWSDVDILIIGDFGEPYLERLRKLLEMTENISEPVEPHPYRLDEALKMLEAGNAMLVDALEEGVIIFEGDGINLLKKKYSEMKRKGKLRRFDHTISI